MIKSNSVLTSKRVFMVILITFPVACQMHQVPFDATKTIGKFDAKKIYR
jgi:hypothetical protein